jgi:hypothetical protein
MLRHLRGKVSITRNYRHLNARCTFFLNTAWNEDVLTTLPDLKLFIRCILRNIHLYKQLHAQVRNTSQSTVFYYSYMFRQVCAILRTT